MHVRTSCMCAMYMNRKSYRNSANLSVAKLKLPHTVCYETQLVSSHTLTQMD